MTISEIRVVEIGSISRVLVELIRKERISHPLIITSSSTPYILACQVPQPSLNLGGTTFAVTPRRCGLRNKDTCTRSGNCRRKGRRMQAVELDPGLVERFKSKCRCNCRLGLRRRAFSKASIWNEVMGNRIPWRVRIPLPTVLPLNQCKVTK